MWGPRKPWIAEQNVIQLTFNEQGRVADIKYLINANRDPDVPMPPGLRGGVKFKHNFPADGEYRLSVNDLGAGLYTATMENESTLVMTIDGKIVFQKNSS